MSSSTRVLSVPLLSPQLRIRFLLAAITLAACVPCAVGASKSHSVTPDEADSIDRGVRAFMQTVSHSVTQDGPVAWIKYFDASPAFFMAVNGQMAFPNVAAAQDGTRRFAQTIRQIELKWGDDLRVDPLTSEFAIVAVSFREIQVDTAGHSVTETGYFTGLAEYRKGHWQFRNAHWSAPVLSRQFLPTAKNTPRIACVAGVVVFAIVGVVLVALAPAKQPVEKAAAVTVQTAS